MFVLDKKIESTRLQYQRQSKAMQSILKLWTIALFVALYYSFHYKKVGISNKTTIKLSTKLTLNESNIFGLPWQLTF